VNPVDDFDLATLSDYQAHAGGDWFLVADMGLFKTSLANWTTPSPDGVYSLEADGTEHGGRRVASGLVPILVDNSPPSNFTLEIKQNGEKLPCCAEVTKEGGPLEITVTGEDANFEALSISLRGGCNVSFPVFSKTATAASSTRVRRARASPSPTTVAQGVEPCCYVLEVVVSIEAVVTSTLWAHHAVSTVHSITIA
jgi:hypothetical protein